MDEMKRILAVAVGSERDKTIRAKAGASEVRPYIEGLIDGLASRGRHLGTHYEIDYRERPHLDFKRGQGVEIFTSGQHNLIFAMSTTVARLAQAASERTMPIVGVVSDRKAESLNRARNLTGISARRSQTADQCFEHFLATVPTLKQVHVMNKPGYGPSDRAMKLVKAVAKKRGVTIKSLPVKDFETIERKIAALPKRDPAKPAVAGLFVLPVDSCIAWARQIIDAVQVRKNIPTFFPITDFVTSKSSGALGAHGVPQRKCGELMSEYVDRILWQGADPASLKVTQADDGMFEWVISGAAAKALNIKVPSVLQP
jgi:ABC-type uncharacterized transport system substrate-binding protein